MVQKLNFYFTSRSSFTSHGGHSLCLLNSKVSYPLFLYDWQGTNASKIFYNHCRKCLTLKEFCDERSNGFVVHLLLSGRLQYNKDTFSVKKYGYDSRQGDVDRLALSLLRVVKFRE